MNLSGSIGCVSGRKTRNTTRILIVKTSRKPTTLVLERLTEIRSITGPYVVSVARDKVGSLVSSVAGFII
jgi:hypothetical protein